MPISQAIAGLEELLAERERIREAINDIWPGGPEQGAQPAEEDECAIRALLDIYQNAKDLTEAREMAEYAIGALATLVQRTVEEE